MSDLGSLSQCLVDNDPAARVRARRLRGKALAISVILEVLLLAVMLIWPLITPGELPRRFNITPAPPFPGSGARPTDANPMKGARRPPTGVTVHLRLPTVSARPRQADTAEAPDLDFGGAGGGSGGPGLPGLGPSLPGGTGDHVLAPEPPRPEPPHVRPTRMSEGVMAAMLVSRVEPQYPRIAITAHISGVVHLHAIIGKDGTVRELEVVDGNALLARAALVAVQAWRYQPTRLNGEPVEVETYITVNFVLN
jgi:periplasmic protein TonB